MINILDNSIHWLHVKEEKLKKAGEEFEKKIFIDVTENEKYVSILLADNGTGFAIPTSQVTHPFITTKAYGMGLGLHIVTILMKSQEGEVLFPDQKDYKLPQEYWSGAFVVLQLKK